MLISKNDWRVSAVSDSTLSISLFLVSGHVRRGIEGAKLLPTRPTRP